MLSITNEHIMLNVLAPLNLPRWCGHEVWSVLKQERSSGQDWPDTQEVNGNIDGLKGRDLIQGLVTEGQGDQMIWKKLPNFLKSCQTK
jgi:hypothetical protein